MSKPPGQRRPRLTWFRFPTPGSVAGTSPKWGVPPAERPRLLFNCTYTMTATPIYEYKPVQVADSHLYDAYTNRLLIR